MRTKTILVATAFAVVAAMPGLSHAKSSYLDAFNTKYKTTGTALDSCALCHPGFNTSQFNSYATSFRTAHTGTEAAAFTKIEPLDSDGDKYTNLTEITSKTFPGVATSVPAKLLFTDNFANAAAAVYPNWTKLAGTWTGNRANLTSSPLAIDIIVAKGKPDATGMPALTAFSAGSIETRANLISAPVGTPSGMVVFAYASASKYRYVKFTPTQVIIGQVGTIGTVAPGAKKTGAISFPVNTWHKLRVVTTAAGAVNVYADAATTPKATFNFGASAPGRVGYMVDKATVRFDDFKVSK